MISCISFLVLCVTTPWYWSEWYQFSNDDNHFINTVMKKLESKDINFLNKAYEGMDSFQRSNQKRISMNINDRSWRIFMNILSKLQSLITEKNKESLENKINWREFTCVKLESIDSYDSVYTDNISWIDQYCQNHYRPNFVFSWYYYIIQEGENWYISVSKGWISWWLWPWFVIDNNKVWYIKNWKLILDTIYDSMGTINTIEDWNLIKTGYLRVCQEKCGIFDSEWKQVTPMIYQSIFANTSLLWECWEQYANTNWFRIKYSSNWV